MDKIKTHSREKSQNCGSGVQGLQSFVMNEADINFAGCPIYYACSWNMTPCKRRDAVRAADDQNIRWVVPGRPSGRSAPRSIEMMVFSGFFKIKIALWAACPKELFI